MSGADTVRGAVESAEVVDLARGRRAKRGGGGHAPGMPEECPVACLGRGADGKTFYYLNSAGQLVALTDREHGPSSLFALFGEDQEYLDDHFPSQSKRERVSIDTAKLTRALMQACTRQGPFESDSHIRGRGGSLLPDGRLVYHAGDTVYVDGHSRKPGMIDGHVYPLRAPAPLPSTERNAAAAGKLFEALKGWNWRRGADSQDIDARLLLGWIMLAPFGGALRWRPHIWVTGDSSTGKSTLQSIISAVLSSSGHVHATSPTAAGLYTKLFCDATPVTLDEIEAKPNDSKTEQVISLIRDASSGGLILRSSSGHKAFEFTARSMFLCSSILIPPLESQDLSRMTLLDLEPFSADAVEPDPSPEIWEPIGEIMLRRMLDQWRRWKETLEAYRAALREVGHGARSSLQYGSLLAAADLALGDEIASEGRIALQAAALDPSTLIEITSNAPNHVQALDHLVESVVDPYRGGDRMSVLELVRAAMAETDRRSKALERIGLKIHEIEMQPYLAVCLSHKELARIYEGSVWRKLPSSRLSGWAQAFRRIPGAIELPGPLRFHGKPAKCICIPMEHVYDQSPATPEGFTET